MHQKTHVDLIRMLEKIPGVCKVYFSPPSGIHMKYPCVVLNYENDSDEYADNIPYIEARRYTATVIDEDPFSEIPFHLKKSIPYASMDRPFIADGLNHYVYTIIY